MLTIEIKTEQLLKAVLQLSQPEFEEFIAKLFMLKAKEYSLTPSERESELLLKINHPVPDNLQHRYDELIARRDARTLTSEEHEELLRLTDEVELLEAKRMRHLIELAQLRQITLDELLGQLGLQPPSHA